ncbi:hypothetical protein EVAR_29842_1 [Eumeta japonica]|uniref:Uncharacterized protein n=1 Tax=Eumeta variegata TaxID=151549 RepID=A0A4C1VWF2_EUMVA|nr:hypothetical protein EVAR_29842_1 [Eumeta japonica]
MRCSPDVLERVRCAFGAFRKRSFRCKKSKLSRYCDIGHVIGNNNGGRFRRQRPLAPGQRVRALSTSPSIKNEKVICHRHLSNRMKKT